LPRGAGRGALVSAPQRPCQPWWQAENSAASAASAAASTASDCCGKRVKVGGKRGKRCGKCCGKRAGKYGGKCGGKRGGGKRGGGKRGGGKRGGGKRGGGNRGGGMRGGGKRGGGKRGKRGGGKRGCCKRVGGIRVCSKRGKRGFLLGTLARLVPGAMAMHGGGPDGSLGVEGHPPARLRLARRLRPGLAGAPGRPGRGAPKTSAPGRGAGRCKKMRGATWKHDDEYTVRLEGSNRVSMAGPRPGHLGNRYMHCCSRVRAAAIKS
jgi:hypothetical protein